MHQPTVKHLNALKPDPVDIRMGTVTPMETETQTGMSSHGNAVLPVQLLHGNAVGTIVDDVTTMGDRTAAQHLPHGQQPAVAETAMVTNNLEATVLPLQGLLVVLLHGISNPRRHRVVNQAMEDMVDILVGMVMQMGDILLPRLWALLLD